MMIAIGIYLVVDGFVIAIVFILMGIVASNNSSILNIE